MEGLLLSIAKIAAGVVIGLPLIVYFLQERLLFHPVPVSAEQRAEIKRRFAGAEEIFLNAADGTRLHAWLARPSERAPLVIYFGGNAEEVSWMLEEVSDVRRGPTPGAAWLLVNYRGYGASEGAPSEAKLVADALQWYDHAAARADVDAVRIAVFGRSLGSGVAVQLAALRPVAAVILATPFDSVAAVAKRYYWYLPVDWMLKHRFDSIALAPQMRAPLLCLVAERDEVIPPAHAERLFDAWAGPKRKVVLAGARHNDADGSAPQFWPAVRDFMAEAAR